MELRPDSALVLPPADAPPAVSDEDLLKAIQRSLQIGPVSFAVAVKRYNPLP
jgi:hypothetical protein